MRFQFGKNWTKYSRLINEERIEEAVQSLIKNLSIDSLNGKTFLDVGCGSGLFSLAAHRLGARVVSFDYDLDAVECTRQVKNRYAADSPSWTIDQGSVLDEGFIDKLGKFDVVYSWGVLHHTGDLNKALEVVTRPLENNGKLFISIYNDQGGASRRWLMIKKIYNRAPTFFRYLIVLLVGLFFEARSLLIRVATFRLSSFQRNPNNRGMSKWHDLVDWVGGYPFEFRKPDEIVNSYINKGFTLTRMTTCGSGHGCNEFIFVKRPTDA